MPNLLPLPKNLLDLFHIILCTIDYYIHQNKVIASPSKLSKISCCLVLDVDA